MAAVLATLTPSTIKPGQTLILAGAGFIDGAQAWFSAEGVSETVAGSWVGAGDVRVVVPDLFRGAAGVCEVSIANPGDTPTAPLILTLEAEPDVDDVYPLVSMAAVRRVVGVAPGETLDEVRIAELIRIASAQIASECQSTFRVETFIDALDGDGSGLLTLPHAPIVAVTDLVIDGTPVLPSDVKVYPRYIKFEASGEYDARLRTDQRIFPVGTQNVVVTYQAGYAHVPGDISHACCLQVLFLMNTMPKQGVLNEGNQTAGISTAWSQETLAPAVRTVCNRYKPRKVGVV